jgi:hypothetical protein
MNYEILANSVMIFHVFLILAVLIGILVSVRYKRFRPIEAIILLSSIIIWSIYGGCPLTYLENSLRIYAGNPTPLIQTGFISFYFDQWFNLPITNQQLTITTYITALIFFITSIKWLSPFINFEIIKIRKLLGFSKIHSSSK